MNASTGALLGVAACVGMFIGAFGTDVVRSAAFKARNAVRMSYYCGFVAGYDVSQRTVHPFTTPLRPGTEGCVNFKSLADHGGEAQ